MNPNAPIFPSDHAAKRTAGSAIGRMVERLATRGLVPSAHNLVIWEYADGSGWFGASIETPYPDHDVETHGKTLQAALEELMRATNRGADISPNDQIRPVAD